MAKTVLSDLSCDEVRRHFSYDHELGILTRLTGRRSGKVVGAKMRGRSGYPCISIGGRNYLTHRVVWLHVTGEWPEGVIDHMDGDPTNNRMCNLRSVTQRVNSQNRRAAIERSRTGLIGAFPYRRGRFYAQIRVDGLVRHIGVFSTAEEAHSAYVQAKRALHEGCTI